MSSENLSSQPDTVSHPITPSAPMLSESISQPTGSSPSASPKAAKQGDHLWSIVSWKHPVRSGILLGAIEAYIVLGHANPVQFGAALILATIMAAIAHRVWHLRKSEQDAKSHLKLSADRELFESWTESVIDQLERSKVYVNKVLRVEDAVQIIVLLAGCWCALSPLSCLASLEAFGVALPLVFGISALIRFKRALILEHAKPLAAKALPITNKLAAHGRTMFAMIRRESSSRQAHGLLGVVLLCVLADVLQDFVPLKTSVSAVFLIAAATAPLARGIECLASTSSKQD